MSRRTAGRRVWSGFATAAVLVATAGCAQEAGARRNPGDREVRLLGCADYDPPRPAELHVYRVNVLIQVDEAGLPKRGEFSAWPETGAPEGGEEQAIAMAGSCRFEPELKAYQPVESHYTMLFVF